MMLALVGNNSSAFPYHQKHSAEHINVEARDSLSDPGHADKDYTSTDVKANYETLIGFFSIRPLDIYFEGGTFYE